MTVLTSYVVGGHFGGHSDKKRQNANVRSVMGPIWKSEYLTQGPGEILDVSGNTGKVGTRSLPQPLPRCGH